MKRFYKLLLALIIWILNALNAIEEPATLNNEIESLGEDISQQKGLPLELWGEIIKLTDDFLELHKREDFNIESYIKRRLLLRTICKEIKIARKDLFPYLKDIGVYLNDHKTELLYQMVEGMINVKGNKDQAFFSSFLQDLCRKAVILDKRFSSLWMHALMKKKHELAAIILENGNYPIFNNIALVKAIVVSDKEYLLDYINYCQKEIENPQKPSPYIDRLKYGPPSGLELAIRTQNIELLQTFLDCCIAHIEVSFSEPSKDIETLIKKCIKCAINYDSEEVLLFFRNDKELNNSEPFSTLLDSATIILRASKAGSCTIVANLLNDQEINKDIRDDAGCTPLLLAAMEGHENIVRQFIEINPQSVLARDNFGNTALILACIHSKKNIVSWFVSKKYNDINAQTIVRATALHWACYDGNVEILKELLKCPDIDLNCQEQSGLTPLMMAVKFGRFGAVELLLDQSNLKRDIKNNQGLTAYDMATESNNTAIVNAFLTCV